MKVSVSVIRYRRTVFALVIVAAALAALVMSSGAHAAVARHAAAAAHQTQSGPYILENPNGFAKYNATAGVYRMASGTDTEVYLEALGSYDELKNVSTGVCLGWVSNSIVPEDCSLARAHWNIVFISDFELFRNVYAQQQGVGAYLTGDSVPSGLYLNVENSADADQQWVLSTPG